MSNPNFERQLTPSTDSSKAHTFPHVFANTTYPAVVLPHSVYVDTVTCDTGSLSFSIADQNALSHIDSTWSSSLPIILATLTEGCGSTLGQYTFLLVTRVEVDVNENSAQVNVEEELTIAEALPEVEFAWGTYPPSQQSPTSAGSSTPGFRPPYPISNSTNSSSSN